MKILKICTRNSCQSRMTQGFLQSFDKNIEEHSAGTFPAARINSKAVEIMAEAGINITGNSPKSQ